MKAKENVHDGHRERMARKFIESKETFFEHELLETLLFYSIPRVDTNPLAHRILARFGSLDKVFSATKEQLLAIDGVGEKSANLILLVGEMARRAEENRKCPPKLLSFYETKRAIKNLFDGLSAECLYAFMLNKNHELIATLEFSDNKETTVSADISELSKGLSVYKPNFLIVAHNHLSGSIAPSEEDDVATKKVNLLCEVHGVSLIDHLIYSKGEFFSYFNSQRLDGVKKDADINKLLSNVHKE